MKIGQESRPYGASLYQKVEIFDILGAAFPPPGAIEVKFCTAKRTHVSVVRAKFDVNRCNESPLLGEKPDFWPVSKFNTGSLPLGGILAVIIIKISGKRNAHRWTRNTQSIRHLSGRTRHFPSRCANIPISFSPLHHIEYSPTILDQFHRQILRRPLYHP